MEPNDNTIQQDNVQSQKLAPKFMVINDITDLVVHCDDCKHVINIGYYPEDTFKSGNSYKVKDKVELYYDEDCESLITYWYLEDSTNVDKLLTSLSDDMLADIIDALHHDGFKYSSSDVGLDLETRDNEWCPVSFNITKRLYTLLETCVYFSDEGIYEDREALLNILMKARPKRLFNKL